MKFSYQLLFTNHAFDAVGTSLLPNPRSSRFFPIYLLGVLQFCIVHLCLWSILSYILWRVSGWFMVLRVDVQLFQHCLLKRTVLPLLTLLSFFVWEQLTICVGLILGFVVFQLYLFIFSSLIFGLWMSSHTTTVCWKTIFSHIELPRYFIEIQSISLTSGPTRLLH